MGFLTVLEAGSYTRAAERLGCSKAYLSKLVAELERELGVQLLHRTTRRLTLTAAGETWLSYARQLRELAQEAERAVSATRLDISGTLRITAPTTFGEAFLLDLVLDFRSHHPALQVELDMSIARRDLIADGYDFAFRSTRTLDESLVARAIGVIRDIPVAAPALLARHAPVQVPADLAALPCIRNLHFRDDSEWVLLHGDTSAAIPLAGSIAVNHFGVIKRAALAGAGMARLPIYLVEAELRAGTLVHLLPDWRITPTPLYLVWPQRRHMPLRDRAFLDYAMAWFAEPARRAMLS